MADFVAVLKKTIDGLGEPTPDVREKVYQKARATVGAKLAALNPPPPAAVADRQRQALEDAIKQIEKGFAAKAHGDPLAELDALFAGLAPAKKVAAQPTMAPGDPAPAAGGQEPAKADAAPLPAKAEVRTPVSNGQDDPAPAEDPAAGENVADGLEFDDSDPGFDVEMASPPPARDRSGLVKWVAGAAAALIVFGGAGYGLWLNKDSFAALFGGGGQQAAATAPASEEPPPAAEPEAEAPRETAATPETPEPAVEPPPADAPKESVKFTQRLNPDGSEVDAGPADGAPTVGEGTSMAAVTQPPPAEETAAAEPGEESAAGEGGEGDAAAATETAVPVGQKAIFYEERTSADQGSAEQGSIVWSLVEESPGGDLPAEPAIRAEATIPAKNLQLRMTIRRNADQTLPASHIVELIFLTPDNFAGGAIDNVLRMTMKETEEAAGNPLLGIPAKIADGFFLIALDDGDQATSANTALMRRQNWIDVPIIYKSGRRALVTMEKGIPGEKVFEEALKAWQNASSG